jgi:AraC family transcriptional regulator
MDTLKQFNLAMQYIEAHLADDIDFQQVARLACCSEYHFRRVFSYLAGLSLPDYIRQRRLSQAVVDLQQGHLRVIDVAVKYGYGSADAFTRAFQSLHGVTPAQVKEGGVSVRTFSPITFQLSISGGVVMDYRLVEKPAFNIVGVHKRVPLIYRGVNPEISAMWESLSEEDIAALDALSNMEPHGVLNATVTLDDMRTEGDVIDNYIGVATTAQVPEHWARLEVAPSTWVVFTSKGAFPEALQTLWGRIYAEWMVSSGWELNHGPSLVLTVSEDFDDPEFHCEIWVPIKQPSR